MKRLAVVVLFVVANFGSVLAQNVLNLSNDSGIASYDGSGFQVYAHVSPKGYINLHTGPVSSLLVSGGSFSGGDAFFTYSVPKVSSGTTQNVSGTLVLLSTSTSGGNTLHTYQLSMTFSGYDITGGAFGGYTTQLIKMKTHQTGASVSVTGGTTEVENY